MRRSYFLRIGYKFDGTMTAAVLFQSVYNQGVRYVTAGGNAMLLRRHLEAGIQIVLDELSRRAVPVEGKEQLAQVAESICGGQN